jgi:hypothetical protein
VRAVLLYAWLLVACAWGRIALELSLAWLWFVGDSLGDDYLRAVHSADRHERAGRLDEAALRHGRAAILADEIAEALGDSTWRGVAEGHRGSARRLVDLHESHSQLRLRGLGR